jgi:hypothetical protein
MDYAVTIVNEWIIREKAKQALKGTRIPDVLWG